MIRIRLFLPFIALGMTILLYWLLNQTIIVNNTKRPSQTSFGNINFIRMIKESKIEKKQKIKKELPKQKIIKTPPQITHDILQPKLNINNSKLAIDIPNITLPLNIGNSDFLSGAGIQVSQMKQNSSAMAILRIPPIYPRRAKMLKKEGFVKLNLLISKDGSVKKAKIIESKPKDIFDKSALQSVYGWKFKPKVIDGKKVEQVAQQIVEFKLR